MTVVGIITDRDLKEVVPSTLSEDKDMSIYNTKLSEVMTKNPNIGHPMDFVEESAVIFYDNKIGSLPIVSNNKLVGIITETDLLYKYIELTGAHQPGSQIEVRVPNIPGILFEVSKVFYEQKINVLSVLVYPDKENEANKILVIRIKTMNPLNVIDGLKVGRIRSLMAKRTGNQSMKKDAVFIYSEDQLGYSFLRNAPIQPKKNYS